MLRRGRGRSDGTRASAAAHGRLAGGGPLAASTLAAPEAFRAAGPEDGSNQQPLVFPFMFNLLRGRLVPHRGQIWALRSLENFGVGCPLTTRLCH